MFYVNKADTKFYCIDDQLQTPRARARFCHWFTQLLATVSSRHSLHTAYTVIHHMQVACDNFMLHCIVPTFHTILQLVIFCENTWTCRIAHLHNSPSVLKSMIKRVHKLNSEHYYHKVFQKFCVGWYNWKGILHGIYDYRNVCMLRYLPLLCTAHTGRKMWYQNMRYYTNSILSLL